MASRLRGVVVLLVACVGVGAAGQVLLTGQSFVTNDYPTDTTGTQRTLRGFRTALAWVDAPEEERRRRGIDRDGETFAPHWDAWAAAETEHFARDLTAARADIIVAT